MFEGTLNLKPPPGAIQSGYACALSEVYILRIRPLMICMLHGSLQNYIVVTISIGLTFFDKQPFRPQLDLEQHDALEIDVKTVRNIPFHVYFTGFEPLSWTYDSRRWQ